MIATQVKAQLTAVSTPGVGKAVLVFASYTRVNAGQQIGNVLNGLTVGVFTGEIKAVGNETFAEVTLAVPIFSGGVTYSKGWVALRNITAKVTPTATDYYVANPSGGDVNRRKTPAVLATNLLSPALKNGAFAGTSDGTEQNGFLKLKDKAGATYWMSKNYLRAVQSAVVTNQPKTGPEQNPAQQVDTSLQTGLSALFGPEATGFIQAVKWIGIALLAIVAGAVLAAFVEREPKRKTAR